uniref:Uncharacterized protein n=1 Tax=Sphaerodactylus townsendi TaxID=933632 RepID=A0ACB8FEA9_9SAUR
MLTSVHTVEHMRKRMGAAHLGHSWKVDNTKAEVKKDERVAVLATAELPAKSVDLAAINLTELINGMLTSALKGTKKFFSLLSITSYSSYAFHKVSIVVYNISNLKNIDPAKFPTRYCYCLNNRTNDLTDFTALLVDIIGNSTSSLKEIFKSTSIVSGRNLSDLWEAVEKSPVIRYTFSGNMSDPLDLDSILPNLIPLWEEAEKVLNHTAQGAWTSKTTKMPMRAQTVSSKGGEVLLTEHPTRAKTANLKSPPVHAPSWLQNDIGKGPGISSTKSALVGPPTLVESHDISPGVPPVATPMMSILSETTSPKGKETTSSRFTTWRKTVALIDSEPTSFQVSSWMQAGASKDWESPPTKAEKPVPVTSYGIPPETQPVPTTGVPLPLASPSTERGQDLLKTTEASVTVTQPPSPKTTRASLPIQTGFINLITIALS